MNMTAGMGTPYWFEWEVGLLKCLEMLKNDNIESVVFQSSKFSSLDDVVVNYKDGSTSNIQVKHSDVGENFTFSTILSGDNPLIIKWAEDWQRNKKDFNIKEINIATNRNWGTNRADKCCSFQTFLQDVLPKWKQNKDYKSSKAYENNAMEKIKKKLVFLNEEWHDFIKVINFIKIPNRDEQNKQIRNRISEIIGSDNQFDLDIVERNLINQLRIWTTSSREKEEVSREDVYKAICDKQIEISITDVYPEKPIFPSRLKFAERFTELLKNTQKKLVFLRGLPGSGKTNFISYLSELNNTIVDFRFYSYLPIKKNETFFSNDSGYFSSKYLWESLLIQLKNKFAELKILSEIQFPLFYGFMTDQEKRQTVLKFLGLYSKKIARCVYIFIDGMDHAARAASKGNATFLDSLPRENEIVGNVKFIFVGQPLHDKYPIWLLRECESIEILDLPVIEKEDIALLLEYYGLVLDRVNHTILAESIINVVGNNALNVLFAIYEFKSSFSNEMKFEDYINNLKAKKLDGQIRNYYEWIYNGIEKDFTLESIAVLFAFLFKKVRSCEMSLLFDLPEAELKYYLDKLYPLIQYDEDGYFCYHNDVRLFFVEKVYCNSFSCDVIKKFCEKVIKEDALQEIGYYFLFDALSILEDRSLLYLLYTPQYIIKSLQYLVPIDIIEDQLKRLFDDFYMNKRVDKVIEVCSVVKTYYQLINCVRWNEKEYLFTNLNEKLYSEKYILNSEKDLQQIISDIYFLLQNNMLNRGYLLFEEYLKDYSLQNYLNLLSNEHKINDIVKKLGAVCREYNYNILLSQNIEDSSLYAEFVSGWLEESYNKPTLEDVRITLSFQYYYSKDFFEYLKNVLKKLDLKTIDFIAKSCKDSLNLSSMLEICVEKNLRGVFDKDLIRYIHNSKENLSSDEMFQYDKEKIPHFFKLLFCCYNFLTKEDEKDYDEVYLKILYASHNNEKDRGFKPAIKLYELAKEIFYGFYNCKNNKKRLEEIISELVYFENHYGMGSSMDCNAYEVRRFLFQVIVESVKREKNELLINALCESLAKYVFMGTKPKYYKELIKLFYIYDENIDSRSKIFDFWAGDKGVVWNKEYTDIEYICDDIIQWLEKEGELRKAEKIDRRKRLKLIGYVGRKDYSLVDLLNWYEQLPNTSEKFFYGIRLLTVSDYANEIGDNRLSDSIVRALFDTAISLGPYYVDSLFNINNTPDKFYYWRETLISQYLQYIEQVDLLDVELIALYSIVNAWVKPEIEQNTRYGYEDSCSYIEQMKYDILSKIKDGPVRAKMLSEAVVRHKEVDNETNVYEPPQDETLDVLLLHVKQKGLDLDGEYMLTHYLKTNKYHSERVFEKIDEVIQDDCRLNFVQNFMLPYIKDNCEYGFYGMGYDRLIAHNYKYISLDEFFNLMNVAFSKINKGWDYVYSVVEDMESLSLSMYNLTKFDDPFSIFNKKIDLHLTWITSCSEFAIEFHSIVFDENIKSLSNLAEKYIGTE